MRRPDGGEERRCVMALGPAFFAPVPRHWPVLHALPKAAAHPPQCLVLKLRASSRQNPPKAPPAPSSAVASASSPPRRSWKDCRRPPLFSLRLLVALALSASDPPAAAATAPSDGRQGDAATGPATWEAAVGGRRGVGGDAGEAGWKAARGWEAVRERRGGMVVRRPEWKPCKTLQYCQP